MSQICDVRDRDQVAGYFDKVLNKYDGVDVLINVAGIITVVLLDSMTIEDFQDSMQTHASPQYS